MGAGAVAGITQVLNTDLVRNGPAAINDVIDDVINYYAGLTRNGSVLPPTARIPNAASTVTGHVNFAPAFPSVPSRIQATVWTQSARLTVQLSTITAAGFDWTIYVSTGANVGAATDVPFGWEAHL